MNEHLHILIMAGGSGTRFWPQSRRHRPKQLLPLAGEHTLLEETVARFDGLCPRQNVWILTRRDLRDAVQESLPWMAADRIVAEPEGRNTAPCLVLGSCRVEAVDPEALLLISPADHVIRATGRFQSVIRDAIDSLDQIDGLLTFGIEPDYPATGFGYIRKSDEPGILSGESRCHAVREFKEKPTPEEAREFLASGRYLWNAGIFLWRLSTFRSALQAKAADLYQGWESLRQAITEDDVASRFRELRKVPIDIALMEKASNVRVVVANFPWDDIGSWQAIKRYQTLDDAGNSSQGRVVLLDSKDNTIFSDGQRVIAALGVEGLVLVDTPDALLLCPRERAEEVKDLVEEIGNRGWEEVL